ncbi:hypothetical protein [Sabulibacter ruber]|uniref:hypothetical protein n=1 Tax=Sabulibacter ruber TaxID=2811901 RepID=UPI001A97AC91|nr:hypothetical protein [Sabulibacter ruber]
MMQYHFSLILATKSLLEPIAGPLTVGVLAGLVIFALRRRVRWNRALCNALTKPIVIYRQLTPRMPIRNFHPNHLDYTITPSDPRFYTLPWEHKDALYVYRIRQLEAKCRRLEAKLNAAGIK